MVYKIKAGVYNKVFMFDSREHEIDLPLWAKIGFSLFVAVGIMLCFIAVFS